MSRYASAAMLDNGPQYLQDNCDKVILVDAFTSNYTTANSTAKVAEATLVSGDFAISGADGAARVLTATLTGLAGGNAIISVNPGTDMHLVFVKTGTSEVILVTEESSDQVITSGNPITFNSNPTYTSAQPTA